MDVPEGQQSSSDILIESLEAVSERGISRVIVMCFDNHGNPIGWLTNINDPLQLMGLIEYMKQAILEDEE